MKRMTVRLGERSYPIYIGHQLTRELGKLIRAHHLTGTALIVSQKQIWSQWGNRIEGALESAQIPRRLHLVNPRVPSERNKSIQELLTLIRHCALTGKGADLFLIAVGGGVIGDLTGFAAAIYKRGVPYIQFPTTLTAQIDSAIGGKTGVDLPQGKNLLGSFYQPKFVLVDPLMLQTLPERTYHDGLAEMVKYAAIKDGGLFQILEKRREDILKKDPCLLAKLIARCVAIKSRVVSRDEYDRKAVRVVLNFGHTLGHAIENAASYTKVTHGEAVSIGMLIACDLSQSLSLVKEPGLSERLGRILSSFGLPTALDKKIKVGQIMKALQYDKKSRLGKNCFVLLERIGKTVIRSDVPQRLIENEILKRRG